MILKRFAAHGYIILIIKWHLLTRKELNLINGTSIILYIHISYNHSKSLVGMLEGLAARALLKNASWAGLSPRGPTQCDNWLGMG